MRCSAPRSDSARRRPILTDDPGVAAAAFDLARLTELQELLGTELRTLIAMLVAELARAMAAIDQGLAAGDLAAVARGAHSGRNSALMIDARPVLAALGELEAAARDGDAERATAAHGQLQSAWPALRSGLEHAAA